MTILDTILERKTEEVAALRAGEGEAALERRASAADAPRGFAAALCGSDEGLRQHDSPRVIAEFKRASPSRGVIREPANPAEIARQYESAGAVAMSVLTDHEFFRGGLADMRAACAACSLPVIRKDFTVDVLQILEARAEGADAVLLIVAALDDGRLKDLHEAARSLSLDVLVEVHDRAELDRALELQADVIGINNRDLRTFTTDVAVTRSLLPHVGGRTVVSESGISSADTIRELASEGVHAFLIGESLMAESDPGEALARLRGIR